MEPSTLGPLIPILAITLSMSLAAAGMWLDHKRKLVKLQIEALGRRGADQAERHATEVQALEDRVRVLERIVTDSGYRLGHEIEQLRAEREKVQ